MGHGEIKADQGLLTGEYNLSPMQQWFLETDYSSKSQFNQANIFSIDKKIDDDDLAKTVSSLVEYHDGLRFKFSENNGSWKQTYADIKGELIIEDLSASSSEYLGKNITDLANTYQKSLDIYKGDLIKIVLIKTPESESENRLLFVIHHLVTDGVSWRILLDHFEEILKANQDKTAKDLGDKSSSYGQWIEGLEMLAEDEDMVKQLAYWEKRTNTENHIPFDKEVEPSRKVLTSEKNTYKIELDSKLTQSLLTEVNHAYNTEINDILLSALALTFGRKNRKEEVVVGLEGHGRDIDDKTIDISRTTGWFTCLYPLLLEISEDDTYGDVVQSVKEQIRNVPDKGIGYGLLRYLHPDENIRTKLSNNKWDIIFNYLGQFDQVIESSSVLQNADENTGEGVGEDYPFLSKIVINCMVVEHQLKVNWSYSAVHFEETSIKKFAEEFNANLSAIILHCRQKNTTSLSPSDYGLAPEVSVQELASFLKPTDSILIEDIYRLSPLQEGLLFHHLYSNESRAYNEQLRLDFPDGVDIAALISAFENVMNQNTVLRSSILADDLSIPVQCIHKKVNLPFELLDYSLLSEEEKINSYRSFLLDDIKKGFNFKEAPLMRLTLINMGAKGYKMIWTFHHIILDGWSIPIVLSEIIQAYEYLSVNETPIMKKKDVFRDYIDYIAKRDKKESKRFWKDYMHLPNVNSLLPFNGEYQSRNKGGGTVADVSMNITQKRTAEIKEFAKKNQLTVNSIVQGIWASLVSKYTGNKEVVYGVTVSGRPTDLSISESRVGLYINTIPLCTKMDAELSIADWLQTIQKGHTEAREYQYTCLLYTSPSPRDATLSRMPSSA